MGPHLQVATASPPRRSYRRAPGASSGGRGLTTASAQRVQAPRSGTGGREVEPQEAVEHGGHPAVQVWPEAARGVELEVRDGHLAGQDEGDGAREEAEDQEAT